LRNTPNDQSNGEGGKLENDKENDEKEGEERSETKVIIL